ncbi:hypothetical protein C8R47DRAFT_224935 [Mycena vitilis]|nr:hypothetical protein C8R47DRAFT_224935 [Mycena vitilis]
MSDQCALDAAGNSLPAEKILFYASESDETPIPKGNEPRRSLRSRDTDRLTQSLLVEKQDEEGNVIPVKTRSAPRARKVATHSGGALSSSDEDDGDFVGSEADSGDDSDDCPSLVSLDNDEIAAMLPPKTFSGAVHALRASADGRKEELRKSKNAKARERAKGRKRQQRDEAGGAPPRKRTTIEEVPDEGDNPYRGGGSGGSGGGGGGTGNGAAGATVRVQVFVFSIIINTNINRRAGLGT